MGRQGEVGVSLGEPGTVVVVVVVVTVIVLLIANRSDPLRSWIDGGTTGRPSRRRSLSRWLSLSPSLFSLLSLDLFEMPRSLLLECCLPFLSFSSFLELESRSLSSLLWLLVRFCSLSLSLSLPLSLSFSLSFSLGLSSGRLEKGCLVWPPLPEELQDLEASGLL